MPVINGIVCPAKYFLMQKASAAVNKEINTFSWKKPQFNSNAIRIVLFTDSDVKGRKLIFDSKAIVREEEKSCSRSRWGRGQKLSSLKEGSVQSPASSAQKGLPRYEQHKTGSEIKMLEEMMFGAVGVAYKGTSLKVHVIRSPPQLMLTKVFIPERPKRSSNMDLDEPWRREEPCSFSSAPELSAPKSISDSGKHSPGIAQSVPMDVPSPRQSWMRSIDLIDEDSGLASLTSSDSFQSTFPPPSPGSSNAGSCNSLNRERRWMRVQSTSLESFSRRQSQHDIIAHEIASPARQKRSKLALGIMFGTIDESNAEANRLFENFFFSHIALFEGRLERLRLSVEQAYYSGRTHLFLDLMIHAFESFKCDIQDLYTAPRLPEPVWLNMMSYSSYKYILCERFLQEFMYLVTKFDNKNNNFFMSTLVTAVLTYHLAWVPTVVPAGGVPSNTYLDKHSAKWVDTLAKSHPYNPLWAQLGDLYGSIGFPLKLSRTVVVGKKADLVKKMLYVLSYFIRCSDVLEATEWGSLQSYMKVLDFAETPSDSEKTLFPVTPTPSNSSASLSNLTLQSHNNIDRFTSLNPASLLEGSKKGDQLDLEKVEEDCNSNHSKGSHVQKSNCAACSANRQSTQCSETKLGNSKFYVDSHTPACRCDNSVNSSYSNEPNPIERSNLEKGKSEENITSKKRSLSLKLLMPSSCESPSDNNIRKDNEETADTSANRCRLSMAQVVEDTKVQNVQHVRKSSDGDRKQLTTFLNDVVLSLGQLKRVGLTGSDSKLTAQQHKDKVCKVLSKEEIKTAFLKKGSNSMFNEYFEENIETKTIDDLDEKDLVVELPSVAKQRYISGDAAKHKEELENSSKAPSLPDLSRVKFDTSQGKTDGEKSPRVRLGSLDHTFRSRKKSFNRQLSESKALKGAPGRCRPVTPTELGRRRHMSSTSTLDFDTLDPRAYCKELPMPDMENCDDCCSQKSFDKNFGRSLLGDFSDHYMSDFVLHGTSDRLYQEKMIRDVRMATQYSVLDEPIAEAVCVVADTDCWTVNVCSTQQLEKTMNGQQQCVASHLVSSMIESVCSMWRLKMSPEFCMMHLEDRLQEIYFKSKMMAEYLKGTKHRNMKELIAMLGFDRSDLPLLVAIAGTHTPNFPLVVLS